MSTAVRNRSQSTESIDSDTMSILSVEAYEDDHEKRKEAMEKVDSLRSVWIARGLIFGSTLSPLFFSAVCRDHDKGCENTTFVFMGLFFGSIAYLMSRKLNAS